MSELNHIALKIVSNGKGILAADESTPSMNKKFDAIGVASTPENRLKYREILFSSDGMKDYIGGRGYYAISTKGKTLFNNIKFKENDIFLFGSETQGLPKNALTSKKCLGVLRVPMAERSRSINLANTVSIVLYEALRQLGYPNLA